MAIDGIKVTGANLETKIASYVPGAKVKLHAFRRDELMEFEVVLQATPRDTCDLLLRKDVGAAERERREAWLGTVSPI